MNIETGKLGQRKHLWGQNGTEGSHDYELGLKPRQLLYRLM
jgi:hypothetical protein